MCKVIALYRNHLSGVMVSVLTTSERNDCFDHGSGQKPKNKTKIDTYIQMTYIQMIKVASLIEEVGFPHQGKNTTKFVDTKAVIRSRKLMCEETTKIGGHK
jgi:hypothetical protein